VKEIVFRASERLGLPVCVVANAEIPVPSSPLVTRVLVPHGFNVADSHIAEEVTAEDIVVTADVPLADKVVRKGAVAVDPRGGLYTEDSIGRQLASRNLLHDLRSREVVRGGGPGAFSPADKQRFASALDRELAKRLKTRQTPGNAGE
jgi:hypothetical protein